jgi:hypothetical protein
MQCFQFHRHVEIPLLHMNAAPVSAPLDTALGSGAFTQNAAWYVGRTAVFLRRAFRYRYQDMSGQMLLQIQPTFADKCRLSQRPLNTVLSGWTFAQNAARGRWTHCPNVVFLSGDIDIGIFRQTALATYRHGIKCRLGARTHL